MDLALFGCGQMGRGCAFALATDPDVDQLTLVDVDRERAEELARWLAGDAACRIVVRDDAETAIAGQDALAMALPWKPTRHLIHTAAPRGVPMASITRPPYDELSDLDAVAVAGSAALLLPIGLEPGLTEILAAHVADQLDRTDSLEVLCGGIPQRAREPIGHVAFFGGDRPDHLPIAQRDALLCRAGEPVAVPRFSGLEHRWFDGIGRVQAYHDGMVPWLCRHPALRTADCVQKTVRWPGFGEVVTELARLGLLDDEPVDVDGVPVSPRRLTETVLSPRVRPRPGDADMVLLDVTARGVRAGRPAVMHTRLRDVHDPTTAMSAMARTTGFTLAAATHLLADGAVRGGGWHIPHVALSGAPRERLLCSLVQRGVEWSPPRPILPEPPRGEQETR